MAGAGGGSAAVQRAVAHCQAAVRSSDWESYMAALFLPTRAWSATWAVRAFNVETALVRDHVKDPTIGRMRFAFWRDAVANTFDGRPPDHPVTVALADALEHGELSQSWFRRILTARENDLLATQYNTVQELENYGENTASSLLYLHLESLGVRDTQMDHIASHIGKAHGIATAIRGVPANIQYRKMSLPSEVMAKHLVSAEDRALKDAVLDVATTANNHISTARAHIRDIRAKPGDTREKALLEVASPVLLFGIPCDEFLKSLEKAQFDVFNGRLAQRNWRVPFSLWRRKKLGL
ncbi:isoprenoid synthase domain-containing protein [Zopfochytrium polystomum]|nr:isoprenoid synthase domain-containing protein [Zopfochytrium polystomum]